ncbi:MAG: hypothetical protein AAF658_07230 [Myxococcota bacterium]
MDEISTLLRPWGGPTLSGLWPPNDKRSDEMLADADSTAWHFKLNRMPIPSAVTNRFLSPAPLPEPFASACAEPCRAERLPRLYAGRNEFDLLAAINLVTGLDQKDALNQQVVDALQALLDRVAFEDVPWSVEPAVKRNALLSFYAREASWLTKLAAQLPSSADGTFTYWRRLPDGARVEIRNSVIDARLSAQPMSSSSSN